MRTPAKLNKGIQTEKGSLYDEGANTRAWPRTKHMDEDGGRGPGGSTNPTDDDDERTQGVHLDDKTGDYDTRGSQGYRQFHSW